MGSDEDDDYWNWYLYEEMWDDRVPVNKRDDYEDITESDNQISDYEYYCRKARTCSINGDHSAAIKFYNEVLRLSVSNSEKCDTLCDIAHEYEEIGDYDSAERCWNESCEVASYGTVYIYLAGKGDFLSRRSRYWQAIGAYDDALDALDAQKSMIDSFKLKYYAGIIHSIIASYDELEKDNRKEKYHGELKRAIDRYLREWDYIDDDARARKLSDAAWLAYADFRAVDEALIIIDTAFRISPDRPANDYNRKAIMLDGGFRYDEALKYYDRAISRDKSNAVFLKNKAECILQKIKRNLLFDRIDSHDLDLINDALKILPGGYDNAAYLTAKAEVLGRLDEPVKAKICLALAAKNYDEVDRAEKQLKKLKSSGTYINITGVHYYQHFAPFRQGTVVDLIREQDNPHDPYAIRVEIGGETVGYVANGRHTLINGVKSAGELKNLKSAQAEVQFILLNEWVIAKVI